MLLEQPEPSPYDLHFELLGFPVRIAWTFWLGAAFFGWGLAQGVLVIFDGDESLLLPLVLLWAMCLLVSIVIHELGHALAFRAYGVESSIVLYHFGGLAIPGGMQRSDQGFGQSLAPPRFSEWQDLIIAAAGPALQIASAALLLAAVSLAGYAPRAFVFMPAPLAELDQLFPGRPIDIFGLQALVIFYIFPSVLWALLNLVPVFPLDGGRVMRSVVLMAGGRQETWLWISLVSAAVIGFYGFTGGQIFPRLPVWLDGVWQLSDAAGAAVAVTAAWICGSGRRSTTRRVVEQFGTGKHDSESRGTV